MADNAELIYDTDNGRSGMVACMLLLPIVVPMKFEYFRTKVGGNGSVYSREARLVAWPLGGDSSGCAVYISGFGCGILLYRLLMR